MRLPAMLDIFRLMQHFLYNLQMEHEYFPLAHQVHQGEPLYIQVLSAVAYNHLNFSYFPTIGTILKS